MSMQVLPAAVIGDSNFISSTVAENDYAAWSGGTTYGDGDRCILVSTHRIYESVQAANTNHNPATDDGTWWVEVGPTNRWACFDTGVSTQTTATGTMTVVFTPGLACDTLALINLTGVSEATVTMEVDSVEVFSETLQVLAPVADWEDYFFSPIEFESDAIVRGLPLYANVEISVSLDGGGAIGCGAIVVGRAVDLGGAQYGLQLGIVDFSRKATDDWGNTIIQERAYKKRNDVSCIVENAKLDIIAKKLASLRATPAVWIASDNYSSLIVFGFLNDWHIEISYYAHSHLSLDIEGLT